MNDVLFVIRTLLYMALIGVCSYRLGLTQASINVHDYDEVDASMKLACTAMIDEEPLSEMQRNIEAYNLLRDYYKNKGR